MDVSRIEISPLRSAFPHEAGHFTVWLEANLEALSKRLGLELNDPQREVRVGDFLLDLLCVDANGNKVIIENQLEKTNHDHMGKILVYLVNLEAKTAIWITSEPRSEHLKVVQWLNETTPEDISFYLVKVEAIRIGDSPFAPLFSVMARPDEQGKLVGKEKRELAGRHQVRREFWNGLLKLCKERKNRFANRATSTDSWIAVGSGLSGTHFNFIVLNESARIELYIDFDREIGTANKLLFDRLKSRQAEIEGALGNVLVWDRLDQKRASKIWRSVSVSGLTSPDKWSEVWVTMALAMEAFDNVMRPEVALARKAEEASTSAG